MTGIERLRKVSEQARKRGCPVEHCPDVSCRDCWGTTLDPIADQIERETIPREPGDGDVGPKTLHAMALSLLEDWEREAIERELDRRLGIAADVSMSAYDLLPADEREAIAWVRDHGGIAYVKDAWNVRSNIGRQLERAQAKVERQQRHIEFVQGKCRERRERINELERNLSKSVSDQLKADAALYDLQRGVLDVCKAHGIEAGDDPLRAIDDALDRRLMPEGYEWPRFEDGQLLRYGDSYIGDGGDNHRAWQIRFDGNADVHVSRGGDGDGFDRTTWDHFNKGERVRRPAPKVLDADGVEVELGDDLYSVEGSLKFHVSHVDRANGKIATDAMFAIDKWADPKMYTHRAPVLAADGRPLREGETVYLTNSPTAFVVDDIMTREDGATVAHLKGGAWNRPQYLTHELTDSWERLEKDTGKTFTEYWGCRGFYCSRCPSLIDGKRPDEFYDCPNKCYHAMTRDIVRRAKALAGGA